MDRKLLGAMGESIAAKHYRAAGYELLSANYRTRQGEIDLIAKKCNTIVFIEVKTRTQKSIAAPREFVTKTKQIRLSLAAKSYIAANGDNNYNYRFDVVEVYVDENGKIDINCIENAFSL
ncbi:MAG: YraN family protein [Oscillospiraceae bacterium]